jgi:hypothetical protein
MLLLLLLLLLLHVLPDALQVSAEAGRFQKKGETGRATADNDFKVDKDAWAHHWPCISEWLQHFGAHPVWGFANAAGVYAYVCLHRCCNTAMREVSAHSCSLQCAAAISAFYLRVTDRNLVFIDAG